MLSEQIRLSRLCEDSNSDLEKLYDKDKPDFVDVMTVLRRLSLEGIEEALGLAVFESSDMGLIVRIKCEGLSPGEHGVHIHENPSLDSSIGGDEIKAGLAAGDHYDPENTGRHLGPYRQGHLGDLPRAYALEDGTMNAVLLAPRLTLNDVRGRSIIIHQGGDNYSDDPVVDGGGTIRICGGIIE